jgi:AcrR family transcriptional regulator
MPRPVDTARRAEIARQALAVLVERGVHGTTMSDLAAALGMKRPTLYWYFRDLGALFDAVVADLDGGLRLHVVRRLEGIDHPLDLLGELVAATLDFYTTRRRELMVLVQLWVTFGAEGPARLERRRRELIAPVRDMLIERLAQGITDGRVAPCDPAALVDLAFAVVDGAQLHRVIRDADAQAAADAFRRYTLEPLRLKKRRTK